MFTRLDAGYNRCRPVRLWNGSLRGLRQRRRTTRCSRVSRRDAGCGTRDAHAPSEPGANCAGSWRLPASGRRLVRNPQSAAGGRPKAASRLRLLKALSVAAFLFTPTLLRSQVPTPDTTRRQPVVPPKKLTAPPSPHPEVVNLTLKGVKVVRQDDLRNNIYTTASYCNSLLLKPFCWISKSKYFYTRKYLDHQELHRDVLRIRVYYWKRGYRETEVDTAVVPRGRNQVGVTFTINEGPATVVSDITVNQDSTVLTQREIDDRLALGKNGPLNLIKLDSSRFNLQARMFDKGYADAEVDTATVIDSTSHTAQVRFTLLPKYKTTV